MLAAFLPGTADALQGGEDPSTLPVLIDKQHGAGGIHELSLLYSMGVVNDYTTAFGGTLAYQYGLSEMFGLELSGSFYGVDETPIMKQIRGELAGKSPAQNPELSDMYGARYTGMLNLVFVPIYGKASFASEYDPAFDLFVFAGGGVVGAERQPDVTGGSADSKLTFGFDWGLGLRFYLSRLFALRVEFRSLHFPEPGEYTQKVSGLTSIRYFQAGLQFNFGGDS